MRPATALLLATLATALLAQPLATAATWDRPTTLSVQNLAIAGRWGTDGILRLAGGGEVRSDLFGIVMPWPYGQEVVGRTAGTVSFQEAGAQRSVPFEVAWRAVAGATGHYDFDVATLGFTTPACWTVQVASTASAAGLAAQDADTIHGCFQPHPGYDYP